MNVGYALAIKRGQLDNPPFIDDFPIKTPFIVDFHLLCLKTKG